MPTSAKTVSTLLGLLYEASASPAQWPGFLLRERDWDRSASYFVLVDAHEDATFI